MIDSKGSIDVAKNNIWSGNIKYQALFLADRLLFLKNGGQIGELVSTGVTVAGMIVLAQVGGSLYGLFGAMIGGGLGTAIGSLTGMMLAKKIKNREHTLNDLVNKSVEEAIKADKANFEIPYSEITKIKVSKSKSSIYVYRKGVLNIEGKKNLQFDIIDKQKNEDIESLISLVNK